jgi:hypothetical protein
MRTNWRMPFFWIIIAEVHTLRVETRGAPELVQETGADVALKMQNGGKAYAGHE